MDETTIADCLHELRDSHVDKEPPFLVILTPTEPSELIIRLTHKPEFLFVTTCQSASFVTIWTVVSSGRVKILLGSCLIPQDLTRACVKDATAVFLVATKFDSILKY